jgi:DNA mismatch repair protein MutS2
VEGEVRRLRERGTDLQREDIKAAQDALRSIEDHRREQESRVEQARATAPSNAAPPPVAAGMEVRHRRTERDGVVRSVQGSKAEVQFGAIRMTVPVEDLALRRGGERSGATIAPVQHGGGGARAVLELDLRGQRLEPALQELERQIDAAILGGLNRFSVIHGTGTGVLQKGVRDYLEHRAEVRSYDFASPEEGGFGKTVVELG